MRARALVSSGLLMFALGVAACGGKSPVSPGDAGSADGSGGTPAPSATATATIAGTVVSAGSGSSAVSPVRAIALPGIVVSVVGTSIRATADGRGQFTLPGVPAGDRELQFTGGGNDARLGVQGVVDRERIDVTVEVSGSSAEVVEERRDRDGQIEVEGRISDLDVAGRRFDVGSTGVTVPDAATIRKGGTTLTLDDLQNDDRVHVKGTRDGDSVTASDVVLQQTATRPVELSGTVTDLGGSCPARTFRFGSTEIATSASTAFVKGACSDLADGQKVELKGRRQDDGSVLATRIVFEGKPDSSEGESASGPIASLSGACPTRDFSVGDQPVHTTGSTKYVKGTCGDLANGRSVEVKGATSGGVLTARTVQFEKQEPGDDESGDDVR